LHASQTPVLESHTAVAAGHSALIEQPQVFELALQTGFVPPHATPLAAEHSTHRPLRQMPLAALGHGADVDAPLSPLQAPHVVVTVLQTGLVSGQSALEPQTHVLLTVLQTGAVGVHAPVLVPEHCSQRPPTQAGSAGVTQARDAPDPRSPLQALHVRALTSHSGAPAGHVEFESHPQRRSETMHTGVTPVQAAALVSEHCTQVPPEQAGALADGHGSVVADALSPLHASQTPVAPLHTGLAAGHSALLEHPQVPVAGSHVGVAGPHALEFVAEHCTHTPERQAGAVEAGQARDEAEP
jgi:hypothetical protein